MYRLSHDITGTVVSQLYVVYIVNLALMSERCGNLSVTSNLLHRRKSTYIDVRGLHECFEFASLLRHRRLCIWSGKTFASYPQWHIYVGDLDQRGVKWQCHFMSLSCSRAVRWVWQWLPCDWQVGGLNVTSCHRHVVGPLDECDSDCRVIDRWAVSMSLHVTVM